MRYFSSLDALVVSREPREEFVELVVEEDVYSRIVLQRTVEPLPLAVQRDTVGFGVEAGRYGVGDVGCMWQVF